MRWENPALESEHSRADAALFGADAVVTRTFDYRGCSNACVYFTA
jgi:hypothetical protein